MPKNKDSRSAEQHEEVTDTRPAVETKQKPTAGGARTIGSMMGEIVWLMSQSHQQSSMRK